MGAIHVTSSTPITRAQAQLINRIARAALNEQVVARRLLIRALRRRGLSRQEIGDYVFPGLPRRQRHEIVVSLESSGSEGVQVFRGR